MTDIRHNRNQLGTFKVVNNHAELLGTNYLDIHRQILSMKDTFGLCGILSSHISCFWASPNTWNEVKYSPHHYKNIFDKAIASGLKKSGIHVFWDDHHDLITPAVKWLKIKSTRSFKSALNRAERESLSFRIALICDYNLHGGSHTHWLACKKGGSETAIIAGDLTPFGIADPAIELPIQTLINALSTVIGYPMNLSFFKTSSKKRRVFKFNAVYDLPIARSLR